MSNRIISTYRAGCRGQLVMEEPSEMPRAHIEVLGEFAE